jgi:hypothetical protein
MSTSFEICNGCGKRTGQLLAPDLRRQPASAALLLHSEQPSQDSHERDYVPMTLDAAKSEAEDPNGIGAQLNTHLAVRPAVSVPAERLRVVGNGIPLS